MPKGELKKITIEPRIYKLKTNLYEDCNDDISNEWRDGYNKALNDILDIVQEFRL